MNNLEFIIAALMATIFAPSALERRSVSQHAPLLC